MTLTLVACTVLFFSIAAIFILIWFSYAPLQDLPEWIYQSYIFDWIIHGHGSGLFLLKLYPVPYTALQLYMSAWLTLVSPYLTSKITVITYSASAVWVTRRVIKAYSLDPTLAWPLFVCIFLLNASFWNGYMAYQFGLIILMWYLSLPINLKTNTPILTTFSILAFFSHGMIYFTFIIMGAIFCVTERRLLRFCAASFPSICLALWYLRENISVPLGAQPVVVKGLAAFTAYKLYTFMKAGPYHYFVSPGLPTPADVHSLVAIAGSLSNLVFLVGYATLLITATKRRRLVDAVLGAPEFIIGSVLTFIALILAPVVFSLVNPAERLMYPALFAFTTVALNPQNLDKGLLCQTAKSGVRVALIFGFILSTRGLVIAGLGYSAHRKEVEAPLSRTVGNERTLFAHRMFQFDARMRESQREWKEQADPTMDLAFETGLLMRRSPSK